MDGSLVTVVVDEIYVADRPGGYEKKKAASIHLAADLGFHVLCASIGTCCLVELPAALLHAASDVPNNTTTRVSPMKMSNFKSVCTMVISDEIGSFAT
jgi:hypothetical protein